MASTVFQCDKQAWSLTNKYTAGAAIDVNLCNTGQNPVVLEITNGSDTLPVIKPNDATVIAPSASVRMQLLIGDRLWVAGLTDGAKATLLV